MEKQVVLLKSKYPDLLLLFECGYRMRIFDEDAAIAARVLGIRANRHRHSLQTSVPVHRTHFHTTRLVQAGYKVGIVKQLMSVAMRAQSQSTQQQRQPLERDVVEIYTRATIPESDEESESSDTLPVPRFIMAMVEALPTSKPLFTQRIHEMKEDLGLSDIVTGIYAYDLHTGESIAEEIEDDAKRRRVWQCLTRIEPIEFVLPVGGISTATKRVLESYTAQHQTVLTTASEPQVTHTYRIERLENSAFATSTALQAWNDCCSRLGEPFPSLPALALSCFGGLVAYLRSLRLESALPVITPQRLKSTNQMSRPVFRLSPTTERDLELFQSTSAKNETGSLFSLLDHTLTPFGARRLKQWLRMPLVDVDAIQKRQSAVAWLARVETSSSLHLTGSVLLEELRETLLPGTKTIERSLQRVHVGRGSPRQVLRLLTALKATNERFSSIRDELEVSEEVPVAIGHLVKAFPSLGGEATEWLNTLDAGGMQADSIEHSVAAIWKRYPVWKDEYDALTAQHTVLDQRFDELLASYQELLCDPTVTYGSYRSGGTGQPLEHVLVVPRSLLSRLPSDWQVINTTRSIARAYPREVVRLQLDLDVIAEHQRAVQQKLWLAVLQAIDADLYVPGIQCIDVCADLDALCSLAMVGRLYPNFVLPDFVIAHRLEIVDGRHPMLDLQQGSHVISNSVSMTADDTHGALCLVSGPNMGGKSTLLRMTALLVVLSHVGSFVPATRMTLSVFDGVVTRMLRLEHATRASGDDELEALGTLVHETSRRTLVLLDEPGFGLSSTQSQAIACGVVRFLVQRVGALVLLATHSSAVLNRLKHFPSVQHLVMSYEPAGSSSSIVFQYVAAPHNHVPTHSFALQAAQSAQLPISILEDASIRIQSSI
ncbi:hypothetical protein Poli38472_002636 [Pythium oligandrum]|uniref:DNA mismatch repair proteins mutS family domain-containing protein n=1 Tax=Pythium oligandrum TaxID=41045 RepID=A0A8K1CJ75_PYTOL|nr:hypothetical protein Poli38472_002636 [Pythium oligandrum]|eukprot:TMW63695.1 hypothetical protein Poli38472_002636 [Pythium oligandrum]